MRRPSIAALLLAVCLPLATSVGATPEWSQPQKPFKLYDNSWYVGSKGLSAVLITSPQGHVLIDGTLPQNRSLIEANIRALGFRVQDIKLILNSHAHGDHAGAIAALAQDSGAMVRASVFGARALEAGGKDPEDPQFGSIDGYPPVPHVVPVRDGETVKLGSLAITAHYTPGHTPGGTSWTWRSCEQQHCLNMVYADSLSAISRDGFRFSDQPQRVAAFRRSIATVAGLPCDLLVTPHPDAIDLLERAARRDRGAQPNPLIDRNACHAYAEGAAKRLDARLDDEKAATVSHPEPAKAKS